MKAAKRPIHDYFPKVPETENVQARVPKALKDEVRSALAAEGRTIQDLIEASFRKYIDECRGAQKGSRGKLSSDDQS